MKKILTALLCASIAFTAVFSLAACTPESESEGVKLVALEGAAQVGVRNDIDYYVVPEPAASTRVNAIENLNFVGSLQELYGSSNGYPQAILVAKTDLIENDGAFVSEFLVDVAANSEWLMNESTQAATIVSAVSTHLTEGLSPTFNAKNLTKSVISNCGISFVSATDSKQAVLSFMESLNGVATQSFGTPSDAFFNTQIGTSSSSKSSVSVYMPDGAPALSLAKLMSESRAELSKTVDYNVVNANTIQTYVTGQNPSADICVLPVNLASKLLGTGSVYKMLGTMTNGNLYLVSNGGESISSANISGLKGKTIGVVNLAAVPGLTFKLILKNNNIEYTELV